MVPVLIGGIVAIVVIVGVAIWVLLQRRSRDDVHSVQDYHRQLHTLEEMRSHPSRPDGNGDGTVDGRAAHPSPALRAGSSTVRLTDPDKPLVPPVPPPPVANPARPFTFDDDGGGSVRPIGPGAPDAAANGEADADRAADEDGSDGEREHEPEAEVPGAAGAPLTTNGASAIRSRPPKGEKRAMHSIDHRPRRLGAPLAAIGAVTVLIVVLVVTGLHTTNSKSPHSGAAATVTTTSAAATHHSHGTHHATTTTTAAPVVSAPSGASAHGATYQVAAANYSLALSATSGECWVQATDSAGSVLFSGVLLAGQSHALSATGPLTVIAGAPNAFTATVNGSPVSLPAIAQAPFTLKFLTPGTGTGAGAGPATTGGTGTAAQPG